MLSFFTRISSCIELNQSTFKIVFNKTRNSPVFVEIWSPWCPHCKKFESDWEYIKSVKEFDRKVVIADLNCYKEKQICRFFPGVETPRFYWIEDSESDPVRYTSYTDVNEILNFIRKNLYSRLFTINPNPHLSLPTEVERIKKDNPRDQIFIFNITYSDEEYVDLARTVVRATKHLSAHFILVNDTNAHPPMLYIENKGVAFNFKGKFVKEELIEFIRERSIPPMAIFNTQLKYYVDVNKIDYAAFIFPTMQFGNVLPFAEITFKEYPTVQTHCDIAPKLCNYIYEYPRENPMLAVISKKKNVFYILDGPFTTEKVEQFMEGIRTGANRGYGPGLGIYGSVFTYYYKVREEGGPFFIVIHFPILVFIFFVGSVIYAIIDTIIYNRAVKKAQLKRVKRKKEE